MMKYFTMAAAAALAAGISAAQAQTTAPAAASGSSTMDAIRARGMLVCGVSTGVAGFSLADSQGVIKGIDADDCRAVAAAILGDGNKVRFVPTTTTNRFTALQSGEVDVLIRETTWTLGREGNLGLEFTDVNYYDGTGFLVKTAANVKSAKELDGATVCVEPGTSTELAISDYFRLNNIKFTPVESQDTNQVQGSFLAGRCDAYSTDSSALAGFRFQQGEKAKDLTLLPEIISKEPLGPMVRKGDDKFLDVVKWTHYAQLTAEEEGITAANIDTFASSTNPDVKRLLGQEGDLGKALGVDNKWAYNAIKQVGNFAEIWDRNITVLGVPRGINALWNKGGLQYAPPIR